MGGRERGGEYFFSLFILVNSKALTQGTGVESKAENLILYLTSLASLSLNPIRPGGGGGLRGPDDQTHSCQSETSYSMMPKLCNF